MPLVYNTDPLYRIIDGAVGNITLLTQNVPTAYFKTNTENPLKMNFITPDNNSDNILTPLITFYAYDDVKGYFIRKINLNKQNIYTLQITQSPTNVKYYLTDNFFPPVELFQVNNTDPSQVEFLHNPLSIPIAVLDNNGFITRDEEGNPIVEYIASIDYNDGDAMPKVVVVPEAFDDNINFNNLALWVEVPGEIWASGSFNYDLEIREGNISNSTFISLRVPREQYISGTPSTIAKNKNEVTIPPVQDTSTLKVTTQTLDNNIVITTAETFDSNGIRIKKEVYSDDPNVDTITIETTNYPTTVNRPLVGSCSPTFYALYVNEYFDPESIIINSETIADLQRNTLEEKSLGLSQTTYAFELKQQPNVAKDYLIWGMSVDPNGTIGEPPNQDNASNECLTGDTLITLYSGDVKRLDEIELTDILLCEGNQPTAIEALSRNTFRPFHTVFYFEDGTIIKKISSHCFFNVESNFYKELDSWKIGEHAVNQKGEHIALIKVERVDETTERFGLWTKTGNYYANGLLTSSFMHNLNYVDTASIEQIMDMLTMIDQDVLIQIFNNGKEGLV